MSISRMVFVYKSLAQGGTESMIFTRMKELKKRGVEVRSIFFQDYGGMVDEFRDEIFVSHEEEKILNFLKGFDPQWVLHFDSPELVKMIPHWLPGARQVYEVHTTYPKNYLPLRDRAMLHKVQGIIVPSEYQAAVVRRIIRKMPVPIEVVPNGINEQFFEPQNEKVSTKGPVVVWIGRFEAHKNWYLFLEIVRQLRAKAPEAHFWMIGGSHATEQQQQILWNKIVQYDLVRHFRWFPIVPSHRMPIFLRSVADSGGCILSTSRGESFGLAVLEGMASGCPAVVPDVGGLRELVTPGVEGYIYSLRRPQDACDFVFQIIGNPRLQADMSSRAKSTARKFLPHAVVDRLLSILNRWEDGTGEV